MAIYKQGEITKNEIGKLYLQGEAVKSQVGKVYEFDGTAFKLIYNDKLIAVSNNTLLDGTTYIQVRHGSSTNYVNGTTSEIYTYAGDNYGNSTCRFNVDFKNYSKVTVTFTCAGDLAQSGNDGYCPNFYVVGTASQIAGAYFQSFYTVFLNGCTTIKAKYNANGTETFSYTLNKTSNEPLYVASILGAVNGQHRKMITNSMIFE